MAAITGTTPRRGPRETGGAAVVSSVNPEHLLLMWPGPVILRGIALFWAGFSEAEVQAFTGPETRQSSRRGGGDWATVANLSGYNPPNRYSENFLTWLDFGEPVATRALRLRITAALVEVPDWQPYGGQTRDGKRVWLGDWLALHALADDPLESAVVPAPGPGDPPIPVTLSLPEPGIVTLVIEDSDGRRVRNLLSETPFPAGNHTVGWDGFDDQGVLSFDSRGRVTHFDSDRHRQTGRR